MTFYIMDDNTNSHFLVLCLSSTIYFLFVQYQMFSVSSSGYYLVKNVLISSLIFQFCTLHVYLPQFITKLFSSLLIDTYPIASLLFASFVSVLIHNTILFHISSSISSLRFLMLVLLFALYVYHSAPFPFNLSSTLHPCRLSLLSRLLPLWSYINFFGLITSLQCTCLFPCSFYISSC